MGETKVKKKIIVVKTSLDSILEHLPLKQRIEKAVVETSKIINHSYQFLKLYFISLISEGKPLPIVDKPLLRLISKLFFSSTKKSKKTEIKDELRSFFKKEYSHLISKEENINSKNLKDILSYSADTMKTNFENNIKAHFVDYAKRYINVIKSKKEFKTSLDEKKKRKEIPKKEYSAELSSFCSNLRKILKDVLYPDKIRSDLSKEEIISIREKVLPSYIVANTNPDKPFNYYLKSKPQDFLPNMIQMMIEIEKRGEKIYNVFCRNGFIPNYITIDTEILIRLSTEENSPFEGKTQRGLLNSIKEKEKDSFQSKVAVWSELFKLKEKEKIFRVKSTRRGYSFNFLIYTDGVGCSVTLKKEEKEKVKENEERYLSSLTKKEIFPLQFKKIIAVDPNMQDIIYCVDENNTTFRYTRAQVKKETRSRKYRNIRNNLKKEHGATAIEQELSKFDHKTLDFEKYKEYLRFKNEVSPALRECYSLPKFRELKFNSYRNKRRSEDNLLNNFKSRYNISSEDDVIVAFGDFQQRSGVKFQPPTKGKGMRRIFSKGGYQTFLIDEFRTSKMCSFCCGGDGKEGSGECEYLKDEEGKKIKRDSPRPWIKDKVVVHGLLKCNTCMRLWNRDFNSARNIYKIASASLELKERPVFLSRKKKDSEIIEGSTNATSS